ncbi:MAG: transcription elongation factor GreA [Candidatus Omnitrophica bacterium]|nr:transcription elongation factor GreA [Candidatus Omnitrophota bacterium]
MSKGKITLTRDGYEKLKKELDYLSGERRREIARDRDEARSKGDLSENAEYDAARDEQAMNEKRIFDLQETLTSAQIMDDSRIPKDQALLGATVRVKDLTFGDEFDYMLVSEEESDFEANKISVTSPVGKAMLGHKVGEIVEVSVPAGILRYEIVKISR